MSKIEMMAVVFVAAMTVGALVVLVVPLGAKYQWIGRALCAVWIHGPSWYGPNHGHTRNPLERRCPHCDKRWYGTTISVSVGDRHYRTIGNFRTIKSGEQQCKTEN